jgi:hypothetical protein
VLVNNVQQINTSAKNVFFILFFIYNFNVRLRIVKFTALRKMQM